MYENILSFKGYRSPRLLFLRYNKSAMNRTVNLSGYIFCFYKNILTYFSADVNLICNLNIAFKFNLNKPSELLSTSEVRYIRQRLYFINDTVFIRDRVSRLRP